MRRGHVKEPLITEGSLMRTGLSLVFWTTVQGAGGAILNPTPQDHTPGPTTAMRWQEQLQKIRARLIGVGAPGFSLFRERTGEVHIDLVIRKTLPTAAALSVRVPVEYSWTIIFEYNGLAPKSYDLSDSTSDWANTPASNPQKKKKNLFSSEAKGGHLQDLNEYVGYIPSKEKKCENSCTPRSKSSTAQHLTGDKGTSTHLEKWLSEKKVLKGRLEANATSWPRVGRVTTLRLKNLKTEMNLEGPAEGLKLEVLRAGRTLGFRASGLEATDSDLTRAQKSTPVIQLRGKQKKNPGRVKLMPLVGFEPISPHVHEK
ncbi:hypothetical protein C8R46DRAFT_1024264 [Mycena filopes]|nr:hypothetical protein C8R46DRAFT_1024264 [Mycena filopes]